MDKPINPAAKWLLLLATIALVVLHTDWWNWDKVDPRLLGFLPIGLSYHAGYAVACAVLMYFMVRFAWPKHLERAEEQAAPGNPSDAARNRGAGH